MAHPQGNPYLSTGIDVPAYSGKLNLKSSTFRCYYDVYNCRWLVRFREAGRDRLMIRARFLMECKLGRALSTNEQVRHRDYDSTNDAIENLYVYERFSLVGAGAR